jgi:exodeoxyribonuclease VII small subunit
MKLDDNLKKIEEIVASMENTDISISEGVKLFEEGANIAKECLKELKDIKGKVNVIKKDLDAYREENLD